LDGALGHDAAAVGVEAVVCLAVELLDFFAAELFAAAFGDPLRAAEAAEDVVVEAEEAFGAVAGTFATPRGAGPPTETARESAVVASSWQPGRTGIFIGKRGLFDHFDLM
jgi:hypothetical protein